VLADNEIVKVERFENIIRVYLVAFAAAAAIEGLADEQYVRSVVRVVYGGRFPDTGANEISQLVLLHAYAKVGF
jgi:hypothetical protein